MASGNGRHCTWDGRNLNSKLKHASHGCQMAICFSTKIFVLFGDVVEKFSTVLPPTNTKNSDQPFALFQVTTPFGQQGYKEREYGKVMMEYIGATGAPVAFGSVPIENGIDFHFILAFAIDADASGNAQNGKFSPYWAETLTPESVAAIKARHSNVKVLASLSGWSLHHKVIRWYDPVDPKLWISNAFSSLKSLAVTYHLDGIDMDYEIFPRRGNISTNFAHCIGELITLLKNQRVISVATIAPYHLTVIPYMKLFSGYGQVIDYVNHQFYTDKVLTPQRYLEDFKLRATQFDQNKLLPSYEVNGRGIQGDAFFATLSLLEENGFEVKGILIFSADAASSNKHYYERKSQEFLLNSTTI